MKISSEPVEEKNEQAASRGRPTGDHEAKRMELLRAAMTVISREGYAKASLRKVAQEAGYTTGAVTYYFANKDDLALALVEKAFNRYDAILEPIRESGDIKALFESWTKMMTVQDKKYQLVISEQLAHGRHDPAFASAIASRYSRNRKILVSILATGQKRGTVRDDISADLLADYLSAIGDGWMLMYPLEPQRFTPKRIRTLIDGIVKLTTPIPRMPQ